MMKPYAFNETTFTLCKVQGIEFLFSDVRIDRNSIPKEFPYVYDLRDECDGIPVQAAKSILVNYWGTIIGTSDLMFDEDGDCYLNPEDWDYGYTMTPNEFLKRKEAVS